ncbi:hypothetical protein [Saccharospirillum impatiens]|jgi:hypothetical protein|uniref:hypothetical protein n=1 Tax=Saccharospirillum impatiens TaxID=169438 RepID=UPI0012FB0BC0|nr:hypothetical protein [Saccharospirillum impatiens]
MNKNQVQGVTNQEEGNVVQIGSKTSGQENAGQHGQPDRKVGKSRAVPGKIHDYPKKKG